MININKAVFLDRDGVINEEPLQQMFKKEHFKWINGSKEALKILRKSGYRLIVITNQSRVSRGIVTREDVEEVHAIFKDFVDDIYYCDHKPDHGCKCRKPETELLIRAKNKHALDMEKSFFVGDRTSDILAGKRAGCKTILVKTGYGGNEDKKHDVKPDYVADDLSDAVKNVILKF